MNHFFGFHASVFDIEGEDEGLTLVLKSSALKLAPYIEDDNNSK